MLTISDIMNAADSSTSNGASTEQSDHVLEALRVVHNPRSPNEHRRRASQYLEETRDTDSAPEKGFFLAGNRQQEPIVRHYGLSLIDHAIRYKWLDYSREQNAALRGWVLELANRVSSEDPPYITNKIADLWVEVAKRSWAVDWMDMDELLFRLWEGRTDQKLLVLKILEVLSDDVFTSEDAVAALRGSDLNRACVEIFVPADVLTEHFPNRDNSINIRYSTDGWISRLSQVLEETSKPQCELAKPQENLALKTLAVLRSLAAWIIPKALILTHTIDRICASLAVSNMGVQFAALDTLFALYNRSRFSESDFKGIVGPMFRSDVVVLLKQLYEWLQVDPNDIDDSKYILLKRLSETVFNLGRLLTERPSFLPEDSDLAGFIGLLMQVMKNESLQVSIPALHLWAKFLSSSQISSAPAVHNVMSELLEVCSQRLIRYEALPRESDHPSIVFLNEDIETAPERHAFLGNYARFCNQVVERVVQQQPIDALYHILGQADQVLTHLYDSEPPFNPSTYSKYSIPWLRLDAEFTVIEAALRGCLKWLTSSETDSIKHQHNVMTSNLQVWCDRMLGLIFEDPRIKERVIQLVAGFAVGPLRQDSQFALRVFDYVLETNCPAFPACAAYTEAVNNLQVFATHQLQRLAIRFADQLADIYTVVESKVLAIGQAAASDEQTAARYKSVLFVINHRATSIDPMIREERLQSFVRPIIDQWRDDRLRFLLSDFDNFSQLLRLDAVRDYLVSHKVEQIDEWSAQALDEEGKALQAQMQSAVDALPLRSTKHILGASVEKLELSTPPYDIACGLWQQYLPVILPPLVQFIGRSHACYDPDNWKTMAPELRPIIHRIFTDRFWQHGISQGTRDEFYANIGGTRTTLEGFASSIRATLRLIRETGYRLLFYMSLLGDHFYGLHELSEPLASALFADACALSSHQLTILIDTVRPLLENCPEKHQAAFLSPLLSALFEQVDRKASMEWVRIEGKKSSTMEDDDLTSEMKEESVLRQLTMAAVVLVAALLEPSKMHIPSPINGKIKTNGVVAAHLQDPTRPFILQAPRVLKPLILFCTHALGMHDTRAASLITKVLRTIIPDFTGSSSLDAEVREFISTEVLKACVTSLNDGYFVDMQKDFAQLIASILALYTTRTDTPRQVLLSLPNMNPEKLDQSLHSLLHPKSGPKQQRAIVFDLLQGYRSVALREQGKLPRPDPNKLRSALQQKYITADMEGMELRDKSEEPDLGGVAEMFK